jgi:endonuclease-3
MDGIETHPVTPPRKAPKPKTAAQRAARLEKILDSLESLFPDATCALHHNSLWQLLVVTILSA